MNTPSPCHILLWRQRVSWFDNDIVTHKKGVFTANECN